MAFSVWTPLDKMTNVEPITPNKPSSFMVDLSDRLRGLDSAAEIVAVATEMLGRRLGAARAMYVEMDSSIDTFFIEQDWCAVGVPSVAGVTRRLGDFGPLAIALLRNQVIAVENVSRDPDASGHQEAYTAISVMSHMAVPLVKNGQLTAVLVVHASRPRQWSDTDIALARETVELTWIAAESASLQSRLRRERNQSQEILNSMAEGFALISADWTVLQVNALGAEMTGRSQAEVVGRSLWQSYPEVRGTEAAAMYERVRQNGQAETIETPFMLPDGRPIWLEGRAYPLAQERLAIFFRDITARKLIEQELAQSNRRKDEFLAMLAHELRNPLAPIRAASDLLAMGRLDPERIDKLSRVISRQVTHMTGLLDDLMDVSRVTRGLIELDTKVLDAHTVVNAAIEQVRPAIEAKRHHLVVHMPPTSVHMCGDEMRLVQVLVNILGNAVKYTESGGNIVLRLEVKDQQVLVTVVDNGVGMTLQTVAHAFELFVQGERTADRTEGGLGLGLALVKSLVDLHGGSVTASSPGLGRGSEFVLALPRVEPPKAPHAAAQAHAIDLSRALRVLVVDDNKDAAETLAMLLESFGHEVLVEYDATTALARAAVHQVDVCLLDIGLPGMNGYELARKLRTQAGTQVSTLVAVTGYGQEQDRRSSQEAGFAHHLIKPVDPQNLLKLLEVIARQKIG